MLRSHRIVVVCIVKVLFIRQITFDNISDGPIRRDAIEREVFDLDFIEKSEIADPNKLLKAVAKVSFRESEIINQDRIL